MPSNIKITIMYLIACVEVAHLHRSGSVFLDGVIYDSDCRRIIAVNRGGRLWVPEVFERQAYDASFFDIVKKGSKLGFGGGGGDKF